MIWHSNVGIKKISYVLLALSPCVLIQKYLHRGLGFCPGLMVLTLASAFWPHLASLVNTVINTLPTYKMCGKVHVTIHTSDFEVIKYCLER